MKSFEINSLYLYNHADLDLKKKKRRSRLKTCACLGEINVFLDFIDCFIPTTDVKKINKLQFRVNTAEQKDL